MVDMKRRWYKEDRESLPYMFMDDLRVGRPLFLVA